MAKALNIHPAERMDLEDLDYALRTYPQSEIGLSNLKNILDNQCRITSGFRVEIPDQSLYPGRIIVHNGYAMDNTGQRVFNEEYPTSSRMVTLEGASQTFYVEVVFSEIDSDSDARAFWDPTVDQGADPSGDPRPDGQEFGDTVSTRKIRDWTVWLRTDMFSRVFDPGSANIPVAKIGTDSSGKVTGVATEKAATIILEVLATTPGKLRVQDAQHFIAGDVLVSAGAGSEESKTILLTDVPKGIITLSGNITGSHLPGDILKGTGSNAVNLVPESHTGRYADSYVARIDNRDRLCQGDEVHGGVLSQGTASLTDRSDLNLKGLKDYIDFVAAQVQEMKWGISNPHVSMTDTARVPPGVSVNFPTTPRYYDRAGGVAPGREYTVTVGDGIHSFGDFNGTTQAVILKAVDSLRSPSGSGRILIKAGTYTFSSSILLEAGGRYVIDAEEGAIISLAGGYFQLGEGADYCFRNLYFQYSSTNTTAMIVGSANTFRMYNCKFYGCQLVISEFMPDSTVIQDCEFESLVGHTAMATKPLVYITGNDNALRGVFLNCSFSHYSASALNGFCVCADPLTTCFMQDLSFINCKFITSASNNSAVYSENSTTNNVLFDGCTFSGNNIAIAFLDFRNCSNIKSINCKSLSSTKAHFSGTLVEGIHISGYTSVAASNVSTISFTNCRNVVVENVKLKISSGVSLTKAGIEILCTGSATSKNISLINNYICGDTTNKNTVGIKVVYPLGTTVQRLVIKDNYITECEVGIYADSDTSYGGYLEETLISGNTIDRDNASSVDFKAGIYIPCQSSTIRQITITDNIIRHINKGGIVTNADAIGIWVRLVQFSANISNNNLYSFNGTTGITGIRVGGEGGVISGNVMYGMYSTGSANFEGDFIGIHLVSSGTCVNWSICNNTIREVVAYSGTGNPAFVYGIMFGSVRNLVIDGNTIDKLWGATGTGQGHAAIGTPSSPATTLVRDLVISNNISSSSDNTAIYQAYAGGRLININATTLINATIDGNTHMIPQSTYSYGMGIMIYGGTFWSLQVKNNTIEGHPTGSAIVVEATVKGFYCGVDGNHVRDSTLLAGYHQIELKNLTYSTCNGNICRLDYDDSQNNIVLTDTTFSTCNSNICYSIDGTVFSNIYARLGSGSFTISQNVCWANSTATVGSINTSVCTGLGGIIEGNIVDFAVNTRGGTDTEIDNKVL